MMLRLTRLVGLSVAAGHCRIAERFKQNAGPTMTKLASTAVDKVIFISFFSYQLLDNLR